jgi:hypothetical protein
MRRKYNPYFLGPSGVCDACGARCFVLIEAGIPCYKCHKGIFLHRRFWRFSECPFCAVKKDLDCIVCKGTWVMATPLDDVDLDDLADAYRDAAEKERRYSTPRPGPAAETIDEGASKPLIPPAPPTFAP